MNYQHILFSLENHIARVTLNRSPVNALNTELVNELIRMAGSIRYE
jgi:enoyl-CoA hydratase/carnithine racemase